MYYKTIDSLSPHVLFILLSLATKDRHGYEIMKQVKLTSDGKVTLGPGTLYGALKRLLAEGWIMEVGEKEADGKKQERRKYYHLTELGKRNMLTELQRYEETLEKARSSSVLGNSTLALSLA